MGVLAEAQTYIGMARSISSSIARRPPPVVAATRSAGTSAAMKPAARTPITSQNTMSSTSSTKARWPTARTICRSGTAGAAGAAG